jgi:hypothetical protein
MFEASFMVELESMEQFNAVKKALLGLNQSLKVTFLDSKGIGA